MELIDYFRDWLLNNYFAYCNIYSLIDSYGD
jgi:hypothetical protein